MLQSIQKCFLLSLCVLGSSCNVADTVSPKRQQELLYLLHQDCGSCHGMTLKGGLGPSLLPAALAGKPAEYLRHVITNGVPEKAMPPWNKILQPEEIDFLVEHLSRPQNNLESAQ